MKRFTNPLDNIRIASPCKADWNEMYGNDRKRFCAECKLNVYNLSDMSRDQAEGFLMASEGRVCVRYFRRADGTVLTRNCPVGWRALKRRVSRTTAAAFSVVAGFFGGLFVVRAVDTRIGNVGVGTVPPISDFQAPVADIPDAPTGEDLKYEVVGMMVEPLTEVEGQVDLTEFRGRYIDQPEVDRRNQTKKRR